MLATNTVPATVNDIYFSNELIFGIIGNGNHFTGDSGGPLVCESRANGHVLYLAGIVSTAYEFNESASEERTLKVHCGEKDAYGQFTGLTWYIDWIKERQTDMADEEMWKVFRDSCPGVKCTQSNRCAFRDEKFDCINGRDECP